MSSIDSSNAKQFDVTRDSTENTNSRNTASTQMKLSLTESNSDLIQIKIGVKYKANNIELKV